MLPDLVRGVPVMPVTATFAQNGSCTVQLERGCYVVGEMVNQEYHITARIRVGSAEFVMGECEKAPAPFVTWQRNCKNDGDGPPNFFWGITALTVLPASRISVNGPEMNTKSNKIARRSKNKSAPRRKKNEVKPDE